MLEKTKAIVLHTIRYGDSSLIVQCFTEKWGRQSFLAKGVRNSKKAHKANLYQPLSPLNMDIYFKPQRDLQWIKEASLMYPLNSIQQDIYKRTQALFISEVLLKTLREEEQNLSLFLFLETSILNFESQENNFASYHHFFLFHLTKYLGFQPEQNYSEFRVFFDQYSGSFSENPTTTKIVQEKELGICWKRCFTDSYESLDSYLALQSRRNLFLDSLLLFYSIHMENFGNLKSLEILRTVFDKE